MRQSNIYKLDSLLQSDSGSVTWKYKMYLLHVDLNVLLQAVAVQVQDQIMDKIKAVTYNDQRQLVSQLGFLQRKIEIICIG